MSDHDVSQERQPWDRIEGETDFAWQAFVTFRNLGPGRTAKAAAAALNKATTTLQRWSAANDWQLRARAWDAYCDARDQERDEVERAEGRKSMYERQARVGKQLWERARDVLLPEGDPAKAKAFIEGLPPHVQLKMLTEGMNIEARARLHLTGRGVDPKDAAKLAEEFIDIALRYVPEDSQGAFLSDITALAGL